MHLWCYERDWDRSQYGTCQLTISRLWWQQQPGTYYVQYAGMNPATLHNRAINHDCFSLSCHVLFWSLQRESAKFEVWRFWNTWCQLWLSDWKSCNNIHKMWRTWPKSSLHSTLITIIPILDVSMTQVIHYRHTRQLKFEPQNLRKGVWCIIIKLHYYNELFQGFHFTTSTRKECNCSYDV